MLDKQALETQLKQEKYEHIGTLANDLLFDDNQDKENELNYLSNMSNKDIKSLVEEVDSGLATVPQSYRDKLVVDVDALSDVDLLALAREAESKHCEFGHLFLANIMEDPGKYFCKYSEDRYGVNLLASLEAGNMYLVEYYKGNGVECFENPPVYKIVENYDPKTRSYDIIEDYGRDFNAAFANLEDEAIRMHTDIQMEKSSRSSEVKHFLDARALEDKNIYRVTTREEVEVSRFVLARNEQEIADNFKDRSQELDDIEVCTLDDVPDGDMLFDEDGMPMEAQDARSMVMQKAKHPVSKKSISSNITHSINSGKVEKVHNKELEFEEKKLHERELSRDERNGDRDYATKNAH